MLSHNAPVWDPFPTESLQFISHTWAWSPWHVKDQKGQSPYFASILTLEKSFSRDRPPTQEGPREASAPSPKRTSISCCAFPLMLFIVCWLPFSSHNCKAFGLIPFWEEDYLFSESVSSPSRVLFPSICSTDLFPALNSLLESLVAVMISPSPPYLEHRDYLCV